MSTPPDSPTLPHLRRIRATALDGCAAVLAFVGGTLVIVAAALQHRAVALRQPEDAP